MSRIACLLRLAVVAGLVSSAACGKGKSQGDGGGGTSGSGGGGASGSDGGGTSGSDGGAPITSCPAQAVSETPCTGTFRCEYDFARTCHGRCYSHYVCIDGILMYTGANDGCLQMPCPDGGAGSGGSSAGAGGGGGLGGAAGTSGAGGNGGTGGAPTTGCPMAPPTIGTACTGTGSCDYNDLCRCNVCCYSTYRCTNGRFEFLGANDGCLQITCFHDDSAEAGTAAVCTFGADQTCNDDPRISSIHGRCTDAGACVCNDGGTNPDSGRCL